MGHPTEYEPIFPLKHRLGRIRRSVVSSVYPRGERPVIYKLSAVVTGGRSYA